MYRSMYSQPWQVSGQLHGLVALPQGNSPPNYQLDRMLGGPQNWSGRRGEDKNLASTGTQTPTHQLSNP
jgi:hypothetical protein